MGQQPGHGKRVTQVGLAGSARLPFMGLGREIIRAPNEIEIRFDVVALHPLDELTKLCNRFVRHVMPPLRSSAEP